MKKYFLLVIGLILITAALSIREWLLLEEISIVKNQLKEQATTSMETAQNMERVRYYMTSSVVYERYLEPIIEVASRLLWPNSRSDLIAKWKREIHTQLDDLSANRLAVLSGDAEKGIQNLRTNGKPGLSRLYEILRFSENTASLSCAQTVREEMKVISEAGQKRDQDLLAQIKIEGLSQLKHLDKAVKGMTNAQIGNFLKSGRYLREIQQPVLDLVFQIKQEEVRKSAWSEFERKLQGSLAQKGALVGDLKDRNLRAKHEIEKLFNSMTEAKANETPIEVQVQKNEPILAPRVPEMLPNSPSDAQPDVDHDPVLGSPSDANATDY